MTEQRYTLLQLNQLLRFEISDAMPDEYWVEAELSEVRESGGHCYMVLVEKDEGSNTPVARASAKCWRSVWSILKVAFASATGQTLHAGMKVLLKVYADFHEAYGFSWIVTDIDSTYTLGDMQRRRQEVIRQLKEEGVFDLNKSLRLPLFCQRIAVVSSAGAAGYGDFLRQIEDNDYGFRFHVELFDAIMQGEQVERSIIAALDRINECLDEFQCVVIIRGGGATSDLAGFDTLPLAENVANFPLPVITGIGHERDETVLDMVSHTRVKTPTAAAALLVGRLKEVSDRLTDAYSRIQRSVRSKIEIEHLRLNKLSMRLPALFSVVKSKEESKLDRLHLRLVSSMNQAIERQRHRIDMFEQRAKSLDPLLPLSRGYSITLHNGRAVMRASDLQAGDEIETRLADGTVKSVVS